MKNEKDITATISKDELQIPRNSIHPAQERLERELKIEAALEQVRARTMAMQKSDELAQAANVLFQQMEFLDIPAWSAGYCIWEDEKKAARFWMSSEGKLQPPFKAPLTEEPVCIRYRQAYLNGEEFYAAEYQNEVLANMYQYLIGLPELRETMDRYNHAGNPFIIPTYQVNHVVYFSAGFLLFVTHKPVPESHDIFKRFGKVFDQTYTRFLDLQKAETQARESQIQLALERVRAKTMAMQHSDELKGAAALLFQQVKSLGAPAYSCGYNIWEKDAKEFTSWMSTQDGSDFNPALKIPLTEDANFIRFNESRLSGEKFYVIEMRGERMQEHYRYLKTMPVFREYFEYAEKAGFAQPDTQIHHLANFSHGNLLFITLAPCPEFYDVFKRFAAVFDQTYTRFLDLQKAEAQTRESQIELGLERVRARAMAMQKSGELAELVDTVFKELTKLDFALTWCIINIIDAGSMSNTVWAANPDLDKAPESYYMKFEDYPFHHAMLKGYKERRTKHVYVLEGQEKKVYDEYLFNETEFRRVPAAAQAVSRAMEKYVVSFSFSNFGGLQTVGDAPLSDENLDILNRFGKVFDLTYTRFNDLEKSEKQARESQIQLALERVRARTMAMQKSEELKDIIQVVYDQFVNLNVNIEHTGFIIDYKERDEMNIWLADRHEVPTRVTIPYFDSSHWNSFIEAKEKGTGFFANHLDFEEKNKFYKDLFELIPGLQEETKEYYLSCPALAISTVLLENVGLYIENFSGTPYTEDENNTLMRFGKVFQQTYTRFLDLQKAEAQAKEAQIEAALERVRSRTMAMQRSNELEEVALLLFQQVKELGIEAWAAGFNVWQDDNAAYVDWITGPTGDFLKPYTVDLTTHPVFKVISEAKQSGNDFYVSFIEGEQSKEVYQLLNSFADKGQFQKILDMGIQFPAHQYNHFVFGEQVSLMFITYEPCPADWDIFKRFGKVFEQTYTRFLDLKNSEAQTRESQIQLGLERVRARTMAMQRSEELADAATVLFQQVKALGVPQWTCGFNIFEVGDKVFTFYPGDPDGQILPPCKDIPLTEDPVFIIFDESKKNGIEFYVYESKGEIQKAHYEYMHKLPGGLGDFLQNLLDAGVEFPAYQIDHIANFSQGSLLFITYEHFPEMHDIFKRFAKVFEQTYTRFLDLQKAEALAREAIQRASVDRLRAEIASMRTTMDLERITPLVWNELTTIDVPFVRCGVFIMDEERQEVQTYLSTPEGKGIAASFHLPYHAHRETIQIVAHWQRKEMYRPHWDAADFIDFTKILSEKGAITAGEKFLVENRPTDLYLHFLPFHQGMLYVGDTTPLSDEHLQLVQALAGAFSTAYARYEDFSKLEAAKVQIEKTLVDLKQAQSQLVQSEKMASLGELTAGIAHEIQNPLNFVNNFSEINRELISEMKEELGQGNLEEVGEIATQIENNEEKILHHGKRADAIVKGMLLHSQSGTGKKEPADINALADEYLRLAFHGLRSKDKSFNAVINTDFDSSIGLIALISQDIGRVLLNLYNNAFYAVHQKKRGIDAGYEPAVSVSTKRINDKVEIRVKDNGSGIPQKVKDKIFQPFFTTKPTGQGTGLGLSLSYDIIKAHGGEIEVHTKEAEFTEFIIRLNV